MKNKSRGVLAAFLAAVLSVSAGCASAGTQSSQDLLGKVDPVAAANAEDQSGVQVTDTTNNSTTKEQAAEVAAPAAEKQTVVRTTPAVDGDEQEQQTVQEDDAPATSEPVSTPIIGKSYAEMYPGFKTDGVIPEEESDDEEDRIKTQDDYFEVRFPSNGQKTARAVVLPSSIDNSDSEYFPEVDTQGGLGSCTCWSMVYYQFTYTHNRDRQITTTRDTAFSPKFIYNMVNRGDNNGSTYSEVYSKLKRYGCVLWNMYPYDGEDYLSLPTDAELYRYALDHQLKDFQKFAEIGKEDSLITSPTDSDLNAIKTALANHEVLSYATTFYSWRADHLKATDNPEINKDVVGQEVVLSCDGGEGPHAMAIVGYNDNIWTDLNGNDQIDDGEMGAFKIVNSHGKHYANQGFAWVAYDALNYKSCVEDAYNAASRQRIFESVCRIDVMPETYSPNARAEYTIYTDDRYHMDLKLKAEWANTVVEEKIEITNGVKKGSEYLAFDGTKNASDVSVVIDVNRILNKLQAPSIEEVTWTVTPYSYEEGGHDLTLKAFKIYDTKTGTTYALSNELPCTVKQSSKSFVVHESVNNNAVIYYRGYKDAVIQYALGTAAPTISDNMWFNDKEKHGYVYKYVIPLGSSNAATIKIGDGSGTWDDNGGQYFVVKKGDNFIVTPDVGDPLKVELIDHLKDVNDLGCRSTESMLITGGYTPYEYRLVVKDTIANEIEYETEYKETNTNYYYTETGEFKYSSTPYKPLKETTYQNTVYIRDSAGTEVKQSYTFVVRNEPLTITKFAIDNEKSEYPCQKVMSFTVSTVNDAVNGGNCNCTFTVMKDGKVCYTTTQRMKSYSDQSRRSGHSFNWTPTEGGSYTAIVSRTDAEGSYVFKTLSFKVASNDVKLSSVTVSPQDAVCMGDKVQVTAQASGGTGTYQYRYAVTRFGKEVSSVDYSSNASTTVQLPFETGSCDVIVTVKDGNGQTASYSKTLNISTQPRIKSLSADKTSILTDDSVTITPETKNVAAGLTAANYVYTATLNGQTTTLTTNANKTATWKPTAAGTYTVKLTLKNGDQMLAVGSKTFTVAENPKPKEYTIRVGVIYYINDANSASQFQIHYWNQSGLVGDATCVKTSDTASVSMGSSFWSGAAQKFYIYEAKVPLTATGYKFHIGDKWFGDDGNVSTSNAVYVFEYGDVYRATYRKES